MATPATLVADGHACPYPDCTAPRPVEKTAERRCAGCGQSFTLCAACGGTNRVLATFCRKCGKPLENDHEPLTKGLRPAAVRPTIHALLRPSADDPNKQPPPRCLQLAAAVPAAPLAVEGLLLIPQDDGTLLLLHESDGSHAGRVRVPQPVRVTPALDAGTLWLAGTNTVYALDLAEFLHQPTGTAPHFRWQWPGVGEITQPLLLTPAGLFVCLTDGADTKVYGLGRESGQLLWDVRVTEPLITAPLELADELLLLGEREARIVNAQTGAVVHHFLLPVRVKTDVLPWATAGRVLYADTQGRLMEILLTAGTWELNPVHAHRAGITSLAASEKYIALGHLAGLTLLDSQGGLLWSNDDLDTITVPPLISGESVFVLDAAGQGLLFNTLQSTPTQRGKFLAGGWFFWPPLLLRHNLITVSEGGAIAIADWQ